MCRFFPCPVLSPRPVPVFVHYSTISSEGFKTLKDGESVEYQLSRGEKGLNASMVRRCVEDSEISENLTVEVSTISEKQEPVEISADSHQEAISEDLS